MAKKNKIEKVTSITTADEYGNAKTIKLTGKTGGYTRDTTPALSAVSKTNKVQDIRTVKNEQNGIKDNDIRTIKTEDTQKNLKDAENNLNLKTAERQKKEAEIYEKAGQTFNTKFENPKTQTLTYDTKGQKKTALPEQKITPTQARKQLTKELGEEKEAYDQWKIANYENNLAKANEEDYGLWDKTLGNITRGAASIFSPLTVGEDLETKDEQGNKTYLPSMGELRQQAIQNSYSDGLIGGIAKAGGDILYGGGKMLGAAALDIPTAGIGGKSLYWTSMALDNYKQNINDGYSKDKSLKNTLTNTAIQFISDKMLGGLTKVTTGGEISELERAVGNQLGKVMKDSVAKEYLSKMISEGASEGLEEILGAIADKVTLGKDIDIPDLVKRTAYSSLLGAGTAGFVNASMSLPSAVMQGGVQSGDINNNIDNTISSNEQVREIIEQKENGQIDVEEANRRIADVQNGTYQQNQNNQAVIQEAQKQFDAIQQAEDNGVIDSETANQEKQALTNTINQMTQQNETQERVVQENQQEFKSNDNKTERVETPKIEVKNNVEVGKQYTYQKDGNNIKYEVKEIRDDGNVKIKINSSSDPSLVGRTVVLKNGNITKNSQEYKSNIKYEDLSKDASATRYDKKMYAKAKNTDMDMSNYDKIMEFITPNKAGNYSKQQILSLAEELGKKSKAITGEELKQEAINYWVNKEPYKKTDSKTKYLKMEEFLKSYYKGAGVGTKIETQETTQTKTQETSKVKKKLAERVSGDKLLDTQDFINEIKDTGAKVDDNGYVTVYHQTTPENAQKIMDSGKMSSKEQAIFFSTSEKASQSEGRGNAKLEFKIPAEELELDDLFDDNADVKIKLNGKTSLDVSNYLVKEEARQETIEEPKVEEKPKQGPALANVGKTETKTVQEPSVKTKEFKEAQQKVKDGTANAKERKYIKTATEAQNTKALAKDMDDVARNYEVISNKKSMSQAESQLSSFETVDEKAKYINSLLTSGKRITAADITAAQLVLKDAAATKNAKLYTDVLADTSILATEYGQVIQALSQIKKLSPTSQLDVLEKIIKREKAKGNKAYENLKITENMRNKVLDCYDENGNIDQEKFDETMDDIKQELADNMKTSWKDKVRAWRYLSMLGNPKTHVRNEVANVAMSVVKGVKDLGSGLAQDLIIRDKSKKTRTALKFSSNEVKSLATTAYNEISNENFGNKYNEQSDLESRQKIFRTGFLEALRKFNDKALSAEDQGFKKINFKKSFANYLTAQGITTEQDIKNNPEIVERAKQFAVMEANVATFNQQNKLSEFINSADTKLGGWGKVIRGAIIPFTRTPLNIAKTGIDYTPGVGLFTTFSEWQNAPKDMKGAVLIDGMSKQMTGAALALVGYALAKSGRVVAGTGDDKDDKFEKDMGAKMDYSIKIGDTSYDLSWLSPSSMPFFVGARAFEVLDKQEGINENLILESLASTLDPLSEMSVIQSFTDVLSSYSQEGTGKIKDMAVSTMQSYLSQFVPTISGQVARLFDDTKRTTMADAGSKNKISQETIRKLQYKIPGARNLLPESTDYYGNKKKEYNYGKIKIGNVTINDPYNAFISPVNKRKDTLTKEDKEVLRLYRKTGNENIVPYSLKQNVKFNDNNYQMTRNEYNKYKKDFGKAYSQNLKALMDTDDYQNATDDEKAEMIEGIMKYAKDKTKDNYLTKKGENYVKYSEDGEEIPYESDKVDEITGDRYGIYDYYIFKVNAPNVVSGNIDNQKKKLSFANVFNMDMKTYSDYLEDVSNIKADYNSKGKAIRNSRKQKIYDYINSFDLTKEQKEALFKQNYKTYKNADRTLFNTINNSSLTLEEKESLANFLKIGG